MTENFDDPRNQDSLYRTAPEDNITEAIKARALMLPNPNPMMARANKDINGAVREITLAVIAHVKNKEPFEKVEKIALTRLRNMYLLGRDHGKQETQRKSIEEFQMIEED